MGLETTGYYRRTFSEILDAKISKAKELFGENINTDENTPLGKYIRINAYDQYKVEELAESVYYSIFPQTAMGTSLDRLGWLVGITRDPALYSSYEVNVYGTAGTNVSAGFLVSTESGITFYNTSDTVIGEDGTTTITVQCTEPGEIGNVNATDITTIVNPAAEIDSVQGIRKISNGVEQESDTEFRKKFDDAKEGQGSTNEASIRAALLKIPTVEDVIVDTDETNHKFTCYLKGGENYHEEIAQTIFDKKPLGIATDGAISVPVSYGALTDYIVKFSHVLSVDVYVRATITTNTYFEANGFNDIKSNLEAHINNTGCGHDLIFTSLYPPVYKVSGVVSAIIEVSTDGKTWVSSDLSIEEYKGFMFKQLTLNGVVI